MLFPSLRFGDADLNRVVSILKLFPSSMAPFSFTGPVKCNRITSFSPMFFYNSCNISLPRKLPRNVHAYSTSLSPFSYQSSIHRNLYSQRQTGISPIAFDAKKSESGGEDNQALDAVLKLYSALRSKDTQELSEILADECRCVCNFLSFFQAFQGKTQVLEFLSYLIRIFGNNVQIVVNPTLQDGMNVGVHWKFEWEKMHVPLGKGFSFHICQTCQGKAVIRNIEMFMEPLLHFEPFRLKMMASLTAFAEKTGSIMVSESENKAKRIFGIVLALLSLAALLFFVKLASYKALS